MKLHSAGSNSAKTNLVCGVNSEISKIIEDIKTFLNPLKRKIISLQQELKLTADSKQKIDVKLLSEEQRSSFKNKLLELKGFIVKKDELEKRMEVLKDNLYPKSGNFVTLSIQKHIIPDLIIRIKDRNSIIQRNTYGNRYAIKDGEIFSYPYDDSIIDE